MKRENKSVDAVQTLEVMELTLQYLFKNYEPILIANGHNGPLTLIKLFERVNGANRKCVTPFSHMPFECENEQLTANILTMDVVLCTKINKMCGMLK